MKQHFLLDEQTIFLNFGSFGACPRPVAEAWQQFQLECERNPVQFMVSKSTHYLQQSREALGAYINCPPDDVVLVTNPGYAVNILAKNMRLQPGDEILTTNLEYGACDRTWMYHCATTGAHYVRQAISLPLQSEELFVNELFAGVSPKTRLIFLSHITSATALIFPAKKVIEKARTLGIPVCVDGAHVPGHIPLDITDLDPDYYTGACHKWMLTPKGTSFLYAKKEHQTALDPLVVSWGYMPVVPGPSQFLDYHQMIGTRDLSAFCAIPAAIQFMQQHNWPAWAVRCREMVYANAPKFAALLQTTTLAPVNETFIGQMLSLPIRTTTPDTLKDRLYQQFHIEVPIMRQGDNLLLRYSIQAFNTQSDLDALYNALGFVIEEGDVLV